MCEIHCVPRIEVVFPWSQLGKLREDKPFAPGPAVIALWRQHLTLTLNPQKSILLTLGSLLEALLGPLVLASRESKSHDFAQD